MRNSNIFFAAILFAIFTLTSCQKDELTELTTHAQTTQSLRAIPAAGIHTVNESATTQFTDAEKANQLENRTSDILFISCDAGPIYADTQGEGSSLDYNNSPCLQNNLEDFKGQDKVYYFRVEDEPEAITTHHITIKNMQDDLDLFVYTMTSEGYIADCKAQSMTIGTDDETIELEDLNAGYYYIVVDAWNAEVTSSFELDFYCTAIGNPVSTTLAENVHSISYEENTGISRGDLFQIIGTDTWYAASQFVSDPSIIRPHIEFKELGRTETAIFLQNVISGDNMYLDLEANKIVAMVNSEMHNDVATITFSSESSTRLVDVLSRITFKYFNTSEAADVNGYYELTPGTTDWVEHVYADLPHNETNANDRNFEETSRDATSVYLYDASRGVTIEINLERMVVIYSDNTGYQSDLMKIVEVDWMLTQM